jgi:gelsolin
MLKQKQYNWKDSNMALFGSDIEKKIKLAASQTELAWDGTGKVAPELRVWRINNFKVEKWEQFGSFYEGDSYIVLKTYKNEGENEIKMDVHFWIGSLSTQDEYTVAAYKTVELDDFHAGVPVQHREVERYESDLFKSYFESITYLKGGCDSGFNYTKPDSYQPRLFHISTGTTRNKTEVLEVACVKGSVNDSDCFIFDTGLVFYLYHGPKSNMHEKNQASVYARKLESERHGKARVEVVDEILSKLSDGHQDVEKLANYTKLDDKLLRLSDATGKMELEVVDSVHLTRGILHSNDIFFVDNGVQLFIWLGKGASVEEKRECMMTATKYLAKTDHPFTQISIYKEGHEDKRFWELFTD